ncbi:MAG: SPASM domain-containing protein, partial [Spirochaetales bacterium]|nr:SPASM domain-containing protein [Spirochaetales bacterium]
DGDIDLDPALYAQLKAEVLASDEVRTIVLGGIGEPSVSPLFEDAVRSFGSGRSRGAPSRGTKEQALAVAGVGRELIITTNGVNIPGDIVKLMAVEAESIVISVDGTADGYRVIRGSPLEQTLATIEQIHETRRAAGIPGSNVSVQFVLSRSNMDDAMGVLELAIRLRVRSMIVSHILPQTESQTRLVMYERNALPETTELFSKMNTMAWRRGMTLILPAMELKTDRWCAFIENDATVVTADGAIAPCYRLAHSYPEYVTGRRKNIVAHSFGSIASSSLASIWNDPGYESFRRTVWTNRYPSCLDCDLVNGCDLVNDSNADCYANTPSCADCPWSR